MEKKARLGTWKLIQTRPEKKPKKCPKTPRPTGPNPPPLKKIIRDGRRRRTQRQRTHARLEAPSERSQREIMATATALSLGGGGRGGCGGTPLPRGYTAAAAGRCCAFPRSRWRPPRLAASRADDSSPAPFEMTVEGALKLLGVAEGASFEEILRAKNAVLASCKDDQDAVAQVPETTSPPLFIIIPFASAFCCAQPLGGNKGILYWVLGTSD